MYQLRIVILVIFAFTFSCKHTFAQVSASDVKASMIFSFSEYIVWPDESKANKLTIGVYGDELNIQNALSTLAQTKQIKQKAVTVKNIKKRDIEEGGIHIVYVSKFNQSDADELLKLGRTHSTLIITDEAEDLMYSHINFVRNKRGQRLSFEVNKQNLLLSKLDYTNQLLLYGGSIVDVKELFQSTQNKLLEEGEKVELLRQENISKTNLLQQKNAAIDSLTDNILMSKAILRNLGDSITDQQQTINIYTKNLQTQKDILKRMHTNMVELNRMQKEQQQSIDKKEREISSLDSAIKIRENKIEEQSIDINIKEHKIENQQRIVLLLMVAGISLVFMGVFMYRAYRIKKNYNEELEKTVEKRTAELRTENTLRKKSEAEVRKREQNYREIFNSTTNAIFLHDMNGNIVDVNEPMLKMYGYKKEDIPHLTIADLSSGRNAKANIEAGKKVKQAIEQGPQVFDWVAKKKDGSEFWVEVSLKVSNIGGENRILAVVRDIDEKKKISMELEQHRKNLENLVTERTIELKNVNEELQVINEELHATNEELYDSNKKLVIQKQELKQAIAQLKETQMQLVEAEKMASVGILAAGVAHEINNPLNFIQGGVYMLKSIAEDLQIEKFSEQINQTIEGIETGVTRATNIVSSLNQFSRQNDKYDENCNIHQIITNCLVMLENKLKHRIEVTKNFSNNDLYCLGNDGKMHQAFLNILSNAEQAIEGKGNITIKTQQTQSEIYISIADSGSGISPENLTKVCDPFFTTKDPGYGTGLGLSITRKIIKDHNGTLAVESIEQAGTTISITLPLHIA